MKLIIDIPEDMYNDAEILIVKDLPELKKIIANGVPIPKNHGRIIDESKIERIYYHIESSENERFRIEHTVIDGTDAPTIIER